MTKKQIMQGNRLIAFFMGGVFAPYDSSWDWLIPCIKKVDLVYKQYENDTLFAEIYYMHGNLNIKGTWLAVVNYIKWYNHILLADKVFPKKTYRSRKNCIYHHIVENSLYKSLLGMHGCKKDKILDYLCIGVRCGSYKEKIS